MEGVERDRLRPAGWRVGGEGRLEPRTWAEILDQAGGTERKGLDPTSPAGVTSTPGGQQAAVLREAWGKL